MSRSIPIIKFFSGVIIVQYQYVGEREYHEQMYRRELRKTTNSLGILLIVFFGANLLLSIIFVAILSFTGNYGKLTSGSALEMLLNGAISSLIFFLIGAVHCLIKRRSFARLFPFERIGAGALATLVTIGITFSLMSNMAAELVTEVFSLFGVQNSGGQIVDDGSLPSVFLYFLAVAIVPAVAEEFAFRGIIMGTLRPYSEGLALVVSSAAFALMHGNFVQIPFTFCCGLVFGLLVIKTNSLLPAIIVHFLNNGLSVAFDVLTSYNIISADAANIGYGVIFVITGILSFFFIRKLLKAKPDFLTLKGADDVLPFNRKMKTVASAPTMIVFEAIMLSYSVLTLMME